MQLFSSLQEMSVGLVQLSGTGSEFYSENVNKIQKI